MDIMAEQHADAGTAVYDAHGAWVGIVSLHNEPGPTLVVQKGRLFPRNVSLPASAIAHADGVGLHLRFSKAELARGRKG